MWGEKSYLDYSWLLERAYKYLPEKPQRNKGERFILPQFEVIISGKKTFIVNFKQVADKLNREPRLFLRYFLKEIGVPGVIEEQAAALQGEVSPRTLNRLLERFFKEYVICPVCNSPDTILMKEKKIMYLKCMACGATSPVRYF